MSLFQKKLVKTQERMLTVALRLTHNRELARDLIQDAVLKALENENNYTDKNLDGWFYRILHSIFINDYHQQVRTNTIIDPSADLYNVDDIYSNDSPESDCNVEQINSAINQLPKDLKAPFSMRKDGYKYIEIVKTLKRPMGTIKNQIFKARQDLQKNLKEYRNK